MREELLSATPLERPADLTNCDREPIHMPGGVQSHGCLLAVSLPNRVVRAVSRNCAAFLGSPPEDLIEKVADHVLPGLTQMIDSATAKEEGERTERTRWQPPSGDLIVTGHVCDQIGFLELERPVQEVVPNAAQLVGRLFAEIDGQPMHAVYDTVVHRIRSFSGFDRVMLYQFHEDAHGSVVAEAKREDQEPFLGLHYPASDIPVPARRLYELNWIRTIADVNAEPVAMHPSVERTSGRPLNMSFVNLRAISPIHLEYLRNMRVGASMSISIMNGERLWGLIACHHNSARIVSPAMRDACELAGSLLSAYLTSRQQQELLQQQVTVSDSLSMQFAAIASHEDFADGLERVIPSLAGLLNADGVVLISSRQQFCWGEVPNDASIEHLASALASRTDDPIYWTDEIASWLPEARRYADRCAGLLSIRLGTRQGGRLLFFRPPFANTIVWAGDPAKSVTDESGRLTPRKSFAEFRQQVAHRSKAWTVGDRETARLLANGLKTLLAEQAARLDRTNEELRQLNADLDAFAYAASHDLKEPLRGMLHHLSLLERAESLTDENFHTGMGGLRRIIKRMSQLLDGLQRFARVGRADLDRETFQLSDVTTQMKDMLFAGKPPRDVDLRVEEAKITGDFACVREILGNLVSNALKYNESETKTVEIGVVPGSQTPLAERLPPQAQAIFVRDNGIGIDPHHHQRVFDIFQRLHPRDQFGGGSGAGLTIVRRLVERHGGAIVIESSLGRGTTFYFTLGDAT